MPLTFTNIQHNFRRFHGLSNTEYVFLDMINVLSHADNKKGGWCYQSKETMSDEMELSKPAILKMIEKMIVNGFLIKHPQTKYLRTTDKWKEVYFAETEKQKQWTESRNELLVIPSGKESLPRKALKNTGKLCLPSDGKQSLPKEDFSGKESLPNNNTSFYNNSKDNNREENLQFSPPLQPNLSEIPTGSEKTEKPINLDSVKSEKKQNEKPNSGGGGENVGNSVSLDLDAKIAPLGMTAEKLDFIFLEAERINTEPIRGIFTMWHARRAKETRGVRTCLHYQKIMRTMADSDLSESEIIEGLTMAYQAAWQGLEIQWIKNKTRSKQTQQNGTSKLEQQKQYIADSPLFKGL